MQLNWEKGHVLSVLNRTLLYDKLCCTCLETDSEISAKWRFFTERYYYVVLTIFSWRNKMIVDKYLVKINSICRQCENKNNAIPHSCKAYPYKDGVPVKIWNAEVLKCPYFMQKGIADQ